MVNISTMESSMKRNLTILLSLAMAVTIFACDTSSLESDKEKYSYALGRRVGEQVKNDGVELDLDAFTLAMKDVMKEKESRLSQEETQKAFMAMSQELRKKRDAEIKDELEKSTAFLEENLKKEGVKTTPSGLQYKVLKKGSGGSPDENDQVTVHYKGTLVDGTVFDSSYKRGEPVTFPLNRVIPGWTEGVQLMKKGAKYRLFIPPTLGYGERGNRDIPGNAVLIFDIELLDFKKQG
jgi:FKBP-type peptidyl-prolyl cis-trans isomerase FklB